MRTSVPEDQFVTSLKNGKLGIFRMQTTRDEVQGRLAGQDVWRTEFGSVGVGSLEMTFDENSLLLMRVKVNFYLWEPKQRWTKLLNIAWLDWLASASRDTAVRTLRAQSLAFRLLEYKDDSWGVLRLKGDVSVLIVFDHEGTPGFLHLEFGHRFHELVLMKSMTSYNI